MTAAETIQAAIDRLTELRDSASGAPWEMTDLETYGHKGVVWIESLARGSVVVVEFDRKVGNRRIKENASLIVTLHRTIDVQLAILRDDYETCVKNNWIPDRRVLALAKAILGGTE